MSVSRETPTCIRHSVPHLHALSTVDLVGDPIALGVGIFQGK